MRYVSQWIASVLSGLFVMAGQIDLRAEEIDYLRDIKPLFATHCYACHGALKQEAGLRVDTAEAMRQGGDSGAAVVSGAVDASLLLQRISSTDATARMPPEGKGLSADQIAKVTDWIRGGAMGPVMSSLRPTQDCTGLSNHQACMDCPTGTEIGPQKVQSLAMQSTFG